MANKSIKKMATGGSAPKPGTSSQIGAFLKNPGSFSVMKKGGSVGKQNYDKTTATNNAKTVSAVPKKSITKSVGMMKKGGTVGKSKKSLKKLEEGGVPYPKGNLSGQDSAAFRMGYGKSEEGDGYTGIAGNKYNALGEAAKRKQEAADRIKNSLGFKAYNINKKKN